jgi:SAM-dependent MidA family methyltransferase
LFAQDVLDWSEKKFPEFYRALRYTLDERSPALRARLKERFRARIDGGKTIVLAEGVKARALSTDVPLIIFANEFFDALPVEVLSETGSLRIASRGQRLVEVWAKPSTEELEFLDRYSVHPTGPSRTEVALLAQQTMTELTRIFQRGFLIVIDYGYTREEQLAGRHLDTLMTYRQHSAGPNPYEAPGEQDITAHVNFTALAAAAENGGMQTHKLLTQSQFLLGIGEVNQFADAFEGCKLPQERAKVTMQLKHLVTPSGMGETFHVLLGSQGVGRELLGNLRGLSFAKNVRP